MRSTIIVTGASGFIGRAVLGCSPASPACTMIPVGRDAALETVTRAARSRPEGGLRLLNLAWPKMQSYASTTGSISAESPEWSAYKIWIGDLAGALAQVPGARLFGVGSGIEPYALGERAVLGEPYATYARHKAEVRDILARTPGLSATWLRVHFLFGPHEPQGRIVPSALRACRNGTPFEIGALERRRHWLHVADVARGLLQAVLSKTPQDWDIVGKRAISFRELLKLVEAAVGRPLLLHESDRLTADRRCLQVAPQNRPAFLDDTDDSKDRLVRRLKDYDAWMVRNDGCSGPRAG